MQVSSDPGQGEGWGKEGKEKRGEIRASLLCFSGARLPHIFGRLESLEHNTMSYPYSQNLQDLRLPSALFLPGVPRVPLNRLSVKWTEENGGGGDTQRRIPVLHIQAKRRGCQAASNS